MKKFKNININTNFIIFIIATLFWIIEFFWRKKYFVFIKEFPLLMKINMVLVHILSLFLTYILVFNFYRIIRNFKEKIEKKEFLITIAFLFFTLALFLIVWPGTWSWDDLFLMAASKYFAVNAWQHFFSTMFLEACLCIIPMMAGVPIVQILLASIIVGSSISKLVNTLNIKSKKAEAVLIILLFIPMISFPTLEYLYSGFRMGIYSYLEMYLIIDLLVCCLKREKLTKNHILKITIFTIIVASWRTEAIYYIPFIMIMYILFCIRKMVSLENLLISFCIITVSVVVVKKVNDILSYSKDYSITAVIMPLVDIIKENNIDQNSSEYEDINKIIKIQIIYDIPNKNGEEYFWEEDIVNTGYTEKEYSNFIKTYVKLVLKYPGSAIKSMMSMFYKASGMAVENNMSLSRRPSNSSGNTYELDNPKSNSGTVLNKVSSVLKKPFNNDVRKIGIQILECSNSDGTVTYLYYFVWNLFIPLGLLLISLILSIKMKRIGISFLILSLFLRTAIIIVTESAPYFMYFLSIYLTGYVLSIFVIYMFIFKNKLFDNLNANDKIELKEI